MAALVVGLVVCAVPARAREHRFYVGGGLTSVSVTGDLDGATALRSIDVGGPIVYPGRLEDGLGVALQGGLVLHRNIALELMLKGSSHDSSNVLLPGENLQASLTSMMFAGRFMLPLGDAFEAMGRLGLGPTTVEYDRNTVLPGAALRLNSAFSGLGLVAGAGMALTFDPIGVELSFDRHQVRLDQVETADRRYDLRNHRKLTVDTVNLILTVHLGPRP
jgi:hypothetical protein